MLAKLWLLIMFSACAFPYVWTSIHCAAGFPKIPVNAFSLIKGDNYINLWCACSFSPGMAKNPGN